MADTNSSSMVRFGAFAADLKTGEIWKHGVRLRLPPQPFEVLAALLRRPGEVITRDELHKRLWPDAVFVDHDRGLNKAVNRLRELLGDDADHPRFLETVPQRGYRYIGPIESASAIQTIAVLPLENLSGSSEQDYFADGMTDELIGELARMSSLRVISRTSVMRYKGTREKALPEIAAALGADAVVEGTVTTAGRKVRVLAQLVRAKDDRHVWSKRYERALDDVLALRTEIAHAIAVEVGATVRSQEHKATDAMRRVNPDAYRAFLQGNYFLHQNIRGVVKSIEWFRRAVELDATYAEAYAGLAQALIFAGIYEFRTFADAYREAREAAMKALEMDGASAGAHNALADIHKGLDWDFAAAEREHRVALTLNPSHLLARLWFAETLSRQERHEEALAESARAIDLDPVSPLSHNGRAMFLWRASRFDESIEEAAAALDLDPSHLNALWWQGLAYSGRGDYELAAEALQKGLQFAKAPVFVSALGYVHGRAGHRDKALDAISTLHDLEKSRYVSSANFAMVHAGLEEADAAFEWLDRAFEARDGRVHQLVWPCFDVFRSDARYSELKGRIGL